MDVVHVGSTILCGFQQYTHDLAHTVLIWSMDVPDVGSVAVAEAIVTENFLEDLQLFGRVGWTSKKLVREGSVTFIIEPPKGSG